MNVDHLLPAWTGGPQVGEDEDFGGGAGAEAGGGAEADGGGGGGGGGGGEVGGGGGDDSKTDFEKSLAAMLHASDAEAEEGPPQPVSTLAVRTPPCDAPHLPLATAAGSHSPGRVHMA